jgi:integrase
MRISMSIIKNEHGVFHVRKKVPKKLEAATAQALGASKPRVAWLKQSLGTKDAKEAKRLAPPVLMKFDRVLAQAEALLAELPLRTSLDKREIERIAEYFYAHELTADDEERLDGRSHEAFFQDVARQLGEAGIKHKSPFRIGPPPKFGMSARQMYKVDETLDIVLPLAKHDLARGDISRFRYEIDALLEVFRINLDPDCVSYRELGMAVLKAYVRALEAIARRHKGEPVDTPELPDASDAAASSESLRAALEGWKKAKRRSSTTLREFDYALDRFVELHGDLPIARITRKHVREFREALQQMPKRRKGALIKATLPELLKWGNDNPEAEKVSPATINKLLGGVQAVAVWGRDNGLIPDDVPWADPFSNMRLAEELPTRAPWQIDELKRLLGSPVFTQNSRPAGGRGEAAFWLPLLGLFTGARLGELAPLTTADVTTDASSDIAVITIKEDLEQGRTLKTLASRRVVPVHPELIRIGFLQFTTGLRPKEGKETRLFPLLTAGPRGGLGEAWSKWFGRYIRGIGITNPDSVFHSFRHTFKDALRAAGVGEDVNDALLGQVGPGTVARQYGAKDMVRRFGLQRLADAVSNASYPSLDLSHLYRTG